MTSKRVYFIGRKDGGDVLACNVEEGDLLIEGALIRGLVYEKIPVGDAPTWGLMVHLAEVLERRITDAVEQLLAA